MRTGTCLLIAPLMAIVVFSSNGSRLMSPLHVMGGASPMFKYCELLTCPRVPGLLPLYFSRTFLGEKAWGRGYRECVAYSVVSALEMLLSLVTCVHKIRGLSHLQRLAIQRSTCTQGVCIACLEYLHTYSIFL